jgi:hypothetical protein
VAIVPVRPLEGVVERVEAAVEEGLAVEAGAEAIVVDAALVVGEAVSLAVLAVLVVLVVLAVLVVLLADDVPVVLIKSLRTQPDAPEFNSTLYQV